MTRDSKIQFGAALVLTLALGASGVLATGLLGMAGRYRLTYTEQAEQGQPAQVSLGIAMGAFRGIFVNWLWIRANNLKEDGKFYEANELAKVITQLQPRFPRVWVFHAWNMSYNISVATQTPQERWDWVNAGIKLLRDEGIPANPNDLLLHKELAWIFMHKIGGITDDANQYYKRRMAEEWQALLGPPPLPDQRDRSRDQAIKKYVDWLRPIVEAPTSLDELRARQPQVDALIDRLKAQSGIEKLDPAMLELYERTRAVLASGRRDLLLKSAGEKSRAFVAACRDPALRPAWDALLPFVRRRVLVEVYHMEPERMLRYTQTYGPIDWRHPSSHALYWSARGVELAMPRFRGEIDRPQFDFLNTDRITVQAIQDLFRSGDVYFDYLSSISGQYQMWLATPNVNFIQAYADVLDSMFSVERSGIFNDRGQRQFTMLWNGFENFIREAITYLYRRGQLDEAEQWLTRLRTDARRNLVGPHLMEELEAPLPQFVEKELRGEAARPDIAREQVVGSLLGAYANGLLGNDNELFTRQFSFAASVHKYYMEEQLRATPTGAEVKRMEVMDPDFEMVAGMTFMQFIGILGPDDRERAYANATDQLRCFAYKMLVESGYKQQMDEGVREGGPSFDSKFVAPLIYEDYTRDIQARLDRRRKVNTNIETK